METAIAPRDQATVEANVSRLTKLYAAVVADCCDAAGFRDQIMRHDVKPLTSTMRVVGVAHTALCVEVYQIPEVPYIKELQTVDELAPLDVFVATTNGATSFSLWGELLSTRARFRKAAGAVIDGFARDARHIVDMEFPTFCTGLHLGDTRGRGDVIASGVPIQCGGVTVYPGDYIIGDIDGVCVVPQQAISEILQSAEKKMEGEDLVRNELMAGRSVIDTYEQYGVI